MRKIRIPQISQVCFFLIFLFLFVRTEYRGNDEISLAINSFFRANPLVVVSHMISNFSFTWLLLPGLMMIFFTIVLGRFFCGWICPLGTIIDWTTHLIPKKTPITAIKALFKYYLLFTLLFLALFGVNITGLLDPIAILVRVLTFSIFPVLGDTAKKLWVGLYSIIGEKRDYIAFIYNFLKSNILPFRETFYPLALFSFFIFSFILFLERYEKRNWCKNICPLGTLLGILSRFSIFNRLPLSLCKDCGKCKDICPTGFDRDILQKDDCILCMDCIVKCEYERAKFFLFKNRIENFWQDRRTIIVGMLGGFLLSRTHLFSNEKHKSRLLRPPGVTDERDFIKKCVRCGECIKICLNNALYPAAFQAGVYGIYTPILVPTKGYCEYNCNLCGQVCPTKAIPELPLAEKKKSIIGIAVFDKNHCLPYAKKVNCIVCEEHCPIPQKAIRFEVVKDRDYKGNEIVLKRPYVVDELCIGCGICEYKCPLEEKAGIEVFASKTIKKGDYYGSFRYFKIS